MSTSSLGSVLDSIRAGLAARSGLRDAKVFSGPVSLKEAGLKCIAFGDATLSETAAATGGVREETWQIDGETWCNSTWQGDTEKTIKAARDGAEDLLAEVEAYLNDTYVGTLPDVSLTSGEMVQEFTAEARQCRIRFQLTLENLKTP